MTGGEGDLDDKTEVWSDGSEIVRMIATWNVRVRREQAGNVRGAREGWCVFGCRNDSELTRRKKREATGKDEMVDAKIHDRIRLRCAS